MSSGASEWVNEQMSAAERASSAEQANEWAMRANEQTEEQMAQYSTRKCHIVINHILVMPIFDFSRL